MPPIFWALIAFTILLPLPIMYFVARKQLGPEAGMRRFLAVLPILLGTWVVMLALFYFFPRDWISNRFVVFQFGIAGLLALLMVYLWSRRRQAGALLLDLGPPHNRKILLILNGLLAVIVVALVVVTFMEGELNMEDLGRFVFFAAILSNNMLLASNRTQIRERGLIMGGDLLRWEKIKGYRWEPSKPNVLTLQTTSRLHAFSKPSIPVPPQHRDHVDALMAQHVARSSTQPSPPAR